MPTVDIEIKRLGLYEYPTKKFPAQKIRKND